VRASDSMREEAVATLRRRFAEGYMSPATLEERLDLALRAKTREALRLTLADLPAEEPEPPRATPLDLSFLVGTGRLTLGRHPGCDVVLDDPTISRRHAELELTGRVCRVRDIGSTNGTYVSGRAVTAARLRDGDAVTFGLVTVRLTWSGQASANPS
jgi:predicted component of type VI protein secretion system